MLKQLRQMIPWCAVAFAAAPTASADRMVARPAACRHVVAPEVSAADLVLVGTVTKAGQRGVLLAGRDGAGYVVKAGDCVGRERVPAVRWLDVRPHFDDHDPRNVRSLAVAAF